MSDSEQISDYRGYCTLLAAGDAQAAMLLQIQNLYLQSVERDPWSGGGLLTDLDCFLNRVFSRDTDGCLDRLDHIKIHTRESVKYLLGHIHEEIVRTHILLPIGSVREVDTSTLVWLSRLPGHTVREKLAGKRRIKAVARNWIQDTVENRLLKAFLQGMRELEELKEKSLGRIGRDEAERMADIVNSWLNDEGREIGRYDNLPPNNRLLSDKHYRKIWDGWIWLGELDRMVAHDAAELDKKILEMLFWQLGSVIHASSATALIQLPVKPSTRSLAARPLWPTGHAGSRGTACLKGITRQSPSLPPMPLCLTLFEQYLKFKCGTDTFRVVCRNGDICITGTRGGEPFEKSFSGPTSVIEASSFLCSGLFPSYREERKKHVFTSQFVAADIARVKPLLSSEDGTKINISGRLLGQFFDCGADIGRVFLDCGSAKGLLLSDNSPVIMGEDIFRNADAEDMAKAATVFFERLATQIECRTFQFITPDDVDDFSLNLARRQANLHFRHARTLPRSIGALFDYLKRTPSPILEAECLIIVGSLLGTRVTLTPLIGRRNQELLTKMPESGGYFWERHPSFSFSHNYLANTVKYAFGPSFDSIPGVECFSPADIRDCAEKVTLFYGDREEPDFLPVESYHRQKVKSSLQQFNLKIAGLRKRLGRLGNLPCYYLAADCLLSRVEEDEHVRLLGTANSVLGAVFLAGLEAREDCPPLWRDHIPDLFMRVSNKGVPEYIPLVKNQPIMPKYGETKTINKGIQFTIPAGGSRYHFPLTKQEGGNKIRYEALIQSPHFPLSSDLPCTLEMKYTYGAENPFQLIFLPDKNSGWRHGPLYTEWVNVNEISRESPVPPEPPEIGWADLRHFPSNKGETDILSWMVKGFDLFHYIRELHSFWGQRHLGTQELKDGKGEPFIRISITGFANSAKWLVDVKGDHYCYFTIDKKNIFIHESNWIDTDSSIMESFEIALDCYKNDTRPGYIAKNIHAGHISLERYEKILTKTIGFPAIQIWRDGRSLSDADCPDKLRIAAAHFLEDVEYFRNTDILMDDTWRSLYLCAARMHRDGPPFIRKRLLEDIETTPPTFENYLMVGSIVGDLRLPEQRRIHEILLEHCANRPTSIFSFKALSIAWWRIPAIVNTVESEAIVALVASVTKAFAWTLKNPNQWLDQNSTCLCELVLAMLRTRASNDPKIRAVLDANGRAARKLTESIEGLMDIHAKTPLTMKSYLQLKVNKPTARASLPDLLYVTHMYLTGENGAEDIMITGIDEE